MQFQLLLRLISYLLGAVGHPQAATLVGWVEGEVALPRGQRAAGLLVCHSSALVVPLHLQSQTLRLCESNNF